jgi:hypothetical protein
MNISNLYFYDKYGKPYNFDLTTDDDNISPYYYGEIFLQPLSISLFDNINLFILEKNNDEYYFPHLDSDEKLIFKWLGNDIPEFFLYEVLNDEVTNSPYINELENIELSTSFTNVRYPYQINIAFSPIEEKIYEKYLNVFYYDILGNRTLILKLKIYGEGVGEDERFKIHLENFGIKFNKTDALCLKDYDINEAYPDWESVNEIRKQLIVNKEEIFPYVGTYYGLKNFIDILGYKNVLEIKEYWKNTDASSEYNGKYILVSISDMLDDGKIDNANLLDTNRSIKFGDTFAKTGFLALTYEFTKKSGMFDSNGIPLIEKTTEFTTNEMYYKLHKVKDILQKQFLPVNVQIKDIIGEWCYYISFRNFIWKDEITITTNIVNKDIRIDILPKNSYHKIYDITPLYKQQYSDGLELPIKTFNNTTDKLPGIDPNFKLTDNIIPNLCKSIEDFYSDRKSDAFNKIENVEYEFTDDYMKPIGCPVILSLGIDELKIEDLKNINFLEFEGDNTSPQKYWGNSQWDNIKYLDFFEIEWNIKYNTPSGRKEKYNFTYRGRVEIANKIPQFLPYVGTYDVSVKVWDYTGNVSYKYDNSKIEVNSVLPEIICAYIADDKYNFQVQNLYNVKIEDFGVSTSIQPKVNIVDMNDNSDMNLDPMVLDTNIIYSRSKDGEVYNPESRTWENVTISQNQYIENYGFGERCALRLNNFKNATIDDLFHLRPCDCVFSSDILSGFYIIYPKPGDYIRIGYSETIGGGHTEYIIPNHPNGISDFSLEWLCEVMNNESNNQALRMFIFTTYDCYNKSILGDVPGPVKIILASSRDLSKQSFQYISVVNNNNTLNPISVEKYSFNKPRYGNDRINQYFKENNIDNVELLSTSLPIFDIINGSTSNVDYLIDNKYLIVSNDIQYGNIPMLYTENFLNLQTCKISKGSFMIPRFKHIFFIINNINGKSKYTWTLTNADTKEIIIIVRKNPYFIWSFNEIGNYSISLDIYDYYNNEYSTYIENLISVVSKVNYIQNIELKLNDMAQKRK